MPGRAGQQRGSGPTVLSTGMSAREIGAAAMVAVWKNNEDNTWMPPLPRQRHRAAIRQWKKAANGLPPRNSPLGAGGGGNDVTVDVACGQPSMTSEAPQASSRELGCRFGWKEEERALSRVSPNTARHDVRDLCGTK
ncbi:hypothetical protein FB45DRAFT_863110 [Roridomyces roridus]|uniref:Uncharacterized protein n=1 Tax=Roridomyces roridus TaxID=1738132 RepID=A0AAD7FW25_9AGAR|nr:hypothetical protein FB45DRAFT_863110 [Roridomyces roridus]